MKTPLDAQALAALSDLWQPKFPFSNTRRFATLGTGVAAGLGAALSTAGYRWISTESARGLSAQNAKTFNYDVFSCRTGPISNPFQLQQWVDWAFAPNTMPDTVWEVRGRFYDPFRPMIEPNGFASRDEVLTTRAVTLESLQRVLMRPDMLLIVLDTVESWQDKTSGVSYAPCGDIFDDVFDDTRHEIKTRPYIAVVKALKNTIASIQGANSSMRILLGVSAPDFSAPHSSADTASLLAASASAAMLRTAMGQLAGNQKKLAYLPVYEMGLKGATDQEVQQALVQSLRLVAPPEEPPKEQG